jgi:hypothetical protein
MGYQKMKAKGLIGFLVLTVAFLGGCASTEKVPSVIIHRYEYQAKPAALPPGTPPASPSLPPPVDYPTVYPPAPFDDPTLIVLVNESERTTFYVSIDGQKQIVLKPGQASPNVHLDIGDHWVHVKGSIPTQLGTRAIPDKVMKVRVRPEGRSQILYLRDPD